MVGCDYLDEYYYYKDEIQNAKTLEELEKIESRTGFIAEESSLTDLINKRKKELGYKRYGIIWRELKEPKTVKRAEAAAKRKREEAKKRKEIDESLGKAFRERRKQKEKDDRDRKLKEYMKKNPQKRRGSIFNNTEEEVKRKKEAEDKKRREEFEAKKRAAEEEAKRKNEAEEAKRKEKERKDNDALDDANDLLKGFNVNNSTNKTNKPNDAQQKNNQTFFGNTPDLPLPPSSSPYPGGSDYNPGL